MRVPLDWLREYCDPPLDARGIEQRLTMTGTKVEAIHRHGVPDPEGFVVGRVLERAKHPDADRLSVCEVDLGPARPEGPATIVCGAPNVAAGQTVAVALPGAVMPDGTRLRKAKLRGVHSEGMILAEDELEIGAGHAGVMVLDELLPGGGELAPGTRLAEVLPIGEDVLELEITTNRPDCLGIYEVARELHAATGAPLADPPWPPHDPAEAASPQPPADTIPLAGTPSRAQAGELPGEAPVRVQVRCPELCPRFSARLFSDVAIGPSPPWLKERLMAAGMRPINNVVDITNYVMLLTGQPLHAFDLDRVAGHALTVRTAAAGEVVRTLDGQDRALAEGMILIEDADGPTSIAGVMGGERSEVHEGTTRVLLEAASWSGPSIHATSWALGLRSEASSRYEKGLAPEQCIRALAVATGLLEDLCGAAAAAQTIDLGYQAPPARELELRSERVGRILGASVPVGRQIEILTALDFQIARPEPPVADGDVGSAGVLRVQVPAVRRNDVTREVDLIEEISRIDGLERLPATLPARRGAAGRLSHAQRVRRLAEDELAGLGLHEVVGWSFAEPSLLDRLLLPSGHPLRRVLELENPLSEAQSIMRPTIVGSLLDAARHNISRGAAGVALFESGTVYRTRPAAQDGNAAGLSAADESGAGGTGSPADEHHALGAMLSGPLQRRSWRSHERPEADFFAAKAVLEALLARLRIDWRAEPSQDWPFLHPGRAAAVAVAGQRVGFIGELHPTVAGTWDLPRSGIFAVDLDRLAPLSPQAASFRPFASVPPIRRDLALTLPLQRSAEEALATVREAAGELLESVEIFDVYEGEQIGPGRRSLALGLTFQAPERTLAEEEIAPAMGRIGEAIARIGGEQRA